MYFNLIDAFYFSSFQPICLIACPVYFKELAKDKQTVVMYGRLALEQYSLATNLGETEK